MPRCAPCATRGPAPPSPPPSSTQGLILLSLTTRLPDFQDKWHLSDVTLSLLLLMMILLAGVGSVVAETLAKRRDSALLLRSGLLLIAVAVPVLCLAPTLAVFVAGMAAYGVGLGIVDASTNMQAVALEHRYGRPILPSFHGAWTLGGVIGAGIGAGDRELPIGVTALVGRHPAGRRRSARSCPATTVRPSSRRRSRCRGARSSWSASRWCSSTWSTPAFRPGDRSSSTTPSPPRSGTSRSRRWPTCSPAAPSGSPATGWSPGSASSRSCGSAPSSAPPGWRSWSSPPPGRSPCSASRSSAPASPWSPR